MALNDIKTIIYGDPMIKAVAELAEHSPIFEEFLEDAMRRNIAVFIQPINKSKIVMHVTDHVLHEYYRRMGV